MSVKDPQVYVEHMLECTARIEEYTNGQFARFEQSRLVQDAVIRNLQTLAESSQRLPDDMKCSQPEIPWRDISGFRNTLVNDYLGLDLVVIWSVVEQELPRLKSALVAMR